MAAVGRGLRAVIMLRALVFLMLVGLLLGCLRAAPSHTSTGRPHQIEVLPSPAHPTVTHGNRAAPFLGGYFPIMVDGSDSKDFGKWRRRGVNTIIRFPGSERTDRWDRAAAALGMKVIREPSASLSYDNAVPNLLAWSYRDEPEINGSKFNVALFRQWAAKLRAVNPHRPIFANLAG
jgi:hypothetical protein